MRRCDSHKRGVVLDRGVTILIFMSIVGFVLPRLQVSLLYHATETRQSCHPESIDRPGCRVVDSNGALALHS